VCRDQGAIHQMCMEKSADEMRVGVCVRLCVGVRIYACTFCESMREREIERERERVCVCGKERVCVRHGEREGVRGRERERNRESESRSFQWASARRGEGATMRASRQLRVSPGV